MKFETLHIFPETGGTLTFKKGYIISDDEYMLKFVYIAKSDDMVKTATIFKSKIIGWSYQEPFDQPVDFNNQNK